jgi:hypothetical protein
VFSALWLVVMACAFLTLTGRAAVLSWKGDITGEDFLLILPPLGAVLAFVGLIAWTVRAGRPDEAYLRSWLADRLQVIG